MLHRKVFQIIKRQDFQRLQQKQSLALNEFMTITNIVDELKNKNKVGYVLIRLNLKDFGGYGLNFKGITLSSPVFYINNKEKYHILPINCHNDVPEEYL